MKNQTGESLSLIELARCAGFFDVLRLVCDEEKRLGKDAEFTAKGVGKRSGGKGNGVDPMRLLQDATVARSNVYALAFGVSFPDETEREALPYSNFSVAIENRIATDELASELEADFASDADIREVFENTED